MRKLIALWLILFAGIYAAHALTPAQREVLFNPPVKSGGGGAIIWTATAAPNAINPAFAACPTACDFAGVSIGTASADRIVMVAACHDVPGTRTISAMTIGGVTATQAVYTTSAGASARLGIWYANVQTGTTASISTTMNFGPNIFGIMVGKFSGQSGGGAATPSATSFQDSQSIADPQTVPAVTVPASGIGIVFTCAGPAATQTATWANATNDLTGTLANNIQMAGAHTNIAGSWSPTVTGNSGNGWGFSGDAMVTVTMAP